MCIVKLRVVRRFPSILLLLTFVTFATGGLEHLHNVSHQREDEQRAAAAKETGLPTGHSPLHDETNCEIHAQLHTGFLVAGWVPVLVFLGLFVAFLTLLLPEPVSHRPLLCLDSRGPPVC